MPGTDLPVSWRLGPATPPENESTICVVGSPRGGTSMVAGILRLLGLPMGDQIRHLTNEDEEFIAFREKFVPVDAPPLGLAEVETELKDMISRRNSRYAKWGWKDPYSYLCLAEVMPFLRAPRVVAVLRDPVSTATRDHVETGRARRSRRFNKPWTAS